AARENRDAVRKTCVESGSVEHEIGKHGSIETGELFLQSIIGPGILHIEARRILRLREETEGPRGERKRVVREADRSPAFLHRDIPAEKSRFACTKSAQAGRVHVR